VKLGEGATSRELELMKGKIVLVTGASAGIGLWTAIGLARKGATVVAAARNPEKASAALTKIRERSGSDDVHLLLADLGSLAGVSALARQFEERFDRLEVLINNAGLILGERTLTPDGFETTFAVNHLAPFLLTHLLMPRLRASIPSRVVTVASRAHVRARLDFDDLQSERGYSGFDAYGRSKLANILFTRELARRLAGTAITANCLHPGVVRTDFGGDGDMGGLFGIGWILAKPFLLSPEKGAATSVYLASSPEVAETTGGYFDKCKPSPSSTASRDMAAARHLWEVSAAMVEVDADRGLDPPT